MCRTEYEADLESALLLVAVDPLESALRLIQNIQGDIDAADVRTMFQSILNDGKLKLNKIAALLTERGNKGVQIMLLYRGDCVFPEEFIDVYFSELEPSPAVKSGEEARS